MNRQFAPRGVLPVPQGPSSGIYFASLVGPLLLSAALGVQLMLTATLVIEPPPRPVSKLTEWGASFFMPERDVGLYLAATALGLAVGVAFVGAWNRRLGYMEPPASEGFLVGSLAFQTAVAVAGTALYLNRYSSARSYLATGDPVPSSYLALFAAIAAASIAAALAGRSRLKRTPGDPNLRLASEESNPPTARLRFSSLELLVPVVLAAVIYVPSWRQLSGRFFMEEGLLHWDFYAMGPALAFDHGGALATDSYSMYGVGWPMVFGALASWIPLSYGRMIQVGSIYACIYLAGVYLLLRLLVRRPALAAAGTAVVMLQFFLGLGTEIIWVAPSVTVMRWAFDVWCFIALVLHWTSKQRMWAVAAGGLAGLALIFSTDTGLYLGAALGFYWLCTLTISGDRARHLIDLAFSVLTALIVLIIGFSIASRGGLLSSGFWSGWLEPIRDFAGGFAQLPMATVPNTETVICFAILFSAYLALIGYTVSRMLHGCAQHVEVFNGCLALYGLLNLLHFVGRSYDYTPLRLWIPLAIVLTVLADRARAYGPVRRAVARPYRLLVRLPYVVAGLTAVVLVAGPRSLLVDPLLAYPNLISSAIHRGRPDGICLMAARGDICGLPEEWADTATDFRTISDRLADLKGGEETLAVLDESGSIFYLASNSTPWGRYPRPFVSLYTKQKLMRFKDLLAAHSPDFILSRKPMEGGLGFERWPPSSFGLGPGPDSPYSDAWKELSGVVNDRYQLVSTTPPYQIWRLAQGLKPSARG